MSPQQFIAGTVLASLMVLGMSACPAVADETKPLSAELGFKDTWYLPRTLSEFGDKSAYVITLLALDCPLSDAALPELERLHQEYSKQGVQFIGLYVAPDDSIRQIAARRLKLGGTFPVVKDVAGVWPAALQTSVTPTVVVLDGQRQMRFRGLAEAAVEGKQNPLEVALHLIVDRMESEPDMAKLAGTPIPDPVAVQFDGEVTFAEHIAPLMQQHCQECHRPGTEAPFSLITFDDATAYGEMVAEVVAEERMPPWYAEVGRFENHRGLTRDERQLVAAWVAGGMPAGDLSKLPEAEPSPVSADGWLIDEPDFVLTTRDVHKLPAHGYVPYKYVILPHIFQHDTWIQQCEILPSNPRVVHHCNMAYIQPGKSWSDANFVLGKVPGVQPMMLEKNVGFRIPRGAMLILQIHYTTTGQEEECQISVGMRYARELIRKQFHFLWMVDTTFAIPPGDPAHRVAASRELETDALAVGLFAHMHFRGRDMSFTATYPDGQVEKLLVIPNYHFDWQMAYQFPDGEKILPKGTRIDCVAHYDNSTFNPYNPDPTETVREGQQTFEEMLNGVFFYLDLHEDLNLHIDPATGAVIETPADDQQG